MHRLALARPVSTLVGVVVLVVLGLASLAGLPISLLPSLERPRVHIEARADGRSQDEMLQNVTMPLERRLSALRGVRSLQSFTEDTTSSIIIETEWRADADRLRIDIARRIDGANQIPLDELEVAVLGGDASPTVEVGVLGGDTASSRTALVRNVVLPELARIPGAGRIEQLGSASPRVVVRPRTAHLLARGLGPADLLNRLESVGQSSSVGLVRRGAQTRSLVVAEHVDSLESIYDLRVDGVEGGVAVSDVADISIEEVGDDSWYSHDGESGVLLRIYRAPGANGVALARSVHRRLEQIRPRVPSSFRLEVVSDRSIEVARALRGLGLAALAGVLLGTLILRFWLGRWRPTLALAVVVPASIVASFSAFRVFDVPIDVVSLAGLALAAGMLVDSAIVVLEAIESARARNSETPALEGTSQVALAVVASTLTTAAVFVPLVYLRGLARAFFGEQAFAVVSALGASLLFSLTLTPVLARRGSGTGGGRSPGQSGYLRLLQTALHHPVYVVLVALVITTATFGTAILLPRELVPEAPARALQIDFELPQGASPDRMVELTRDLEEAALTAVEPSQLVSRSTTRGLPRPDGLRPTRREPTIGRIELVFGEASQAQIVRDRLARAASEVPGVATRITSRSSALMELVARSGERLELVVSASTPERAGELARRVTEVVQQQGAAARVTRWGSNSNEALIVTWDDARLARLGLSLDEADQQLSACLGPHDAGSIEIPGLEPTIRVEGVQPSQPSALPILVTKPERRGVPLTALASIDRGTRALGMARHEGRPAVQLALQGPSLDALALATTIRRLPVAWDQQVHLAGEALETTLAFRELGLALALALVLVFLTLAALYESVLLPPLVMTTVPVAAGGGMVTLAITGQSLNIMSLIGVIFLGGIVVNNAIVLVDRVERLRRSEPSAARAIAKAATERYRPILMTTATTILGMLPLAIWGGDGVELRRALATAVVGGSVTALFASLLLVPSLHLVLLRLKRSSGPPPAP